ncbi:helix-turn-helix transcriptional regulator [Streptomyces sp. E11-3]|uniref:helix-turn-helix domain-containing protein n=1 Tax=Streptomyces sp. E11-3 TaxID=3110112 RepID=UPI0039805F24
MVARRRRIGDQIRATRIRANLTQEAVANRVPMERPNYVRIEQGHSAATIDTLIRIADALGVPLRDLIP